MENLLLQCTESEKVADLLASYRRTEEENEFAESWDFKPSYPTTMKVSPRRTSMEPSEDFPRYTPSTSSEGGKRLRWEWVLLVAKSDIVDLALARWLSNVLETTCRAVYAYFWADTWGYRVYNNGELTHHFDQQMEERPVYRADTDLEMLGIGYDLCQYKDCQGPGWTEVVVDPFADSRSAS